MRTLHTPDARATYNLGVALGRSVHPGAVIALVGDLGAGKTVLARGVGEGLEVATRVQSPSFVLVQAHSGGRLPMWHADLYRLAFEEELEQIGLDEILAGEGVTLVEWADRFPALLPTDHLVVRLSSVDDGRRIELEAKGPAHQHLEQVGG